MRFTQLSDAAMALYMAECRALPVMPVSPLGQQMKLWDAVLWEDLREFMIGLKGRTVP